ncbi:hypothetical protein [Paenibacillus sp.]|uniref:hypothetical protein n=1 Tax=Paenibacillus sp. TaxID=58172 RepID=UPI0028268FC6|nr:hypothetical protein [Paenibacillus sp.]MDR0269241.1 hypothetical protein [Paenibacillus sp.]
MFKTKIAIVSSLAAIMMLSGAASANAATPSVPQGQATKMLVSAGAKNDKKTASTKEQIDKLFAGLHPGEMLAYYVPGEEKGPFSTMFASKGYVFKDYNALAAKAEQMKAPSFKISEAFPKNYKFKEGVIYMKTPDFMSELYKKLDMQLKAEAAKGGKEVYTMPVETGGEGGSTSLRFVKGSVEISLTTVYSRDKLPVVGGTPVQSTKTPSFVGPNEKFESMDIGGMKCTYVTDTKTMSRLHWTDANRKLDYQITILAKDAKTDVLEFAKSIIAPEAK